MGIVSVGGWRDGSVGHFSDFGAILLRGLFQVFVLVGFFAFAVEGVVVVVGCADDVGFEEAGDFADVHAL